MYGGTTREDPEYPGILSILDTVLVVSAQSHLKHEEIFLNSGHSEP